MPREYRHIEQFAPTVGQVISPIRTSPIRDLAFLFLNSSVPSSAQSVPRPAALRHPCRA